LGAAATGFLGAGAANLVFTGAAFGVTATGLEALLDWDTAAALAVFNAAEELALTGALAGALANDLVGLFAAVLAGTFTAALTGFACLAAPFGAAAALALALGTSTLAAAFLVEVVTSCLLAA